MSYILDGNGTLTWWDMYNEEILFPEQEIVIAGQNKLRGGAPVCSPIFGPQPKSPAYKGLDLPQHGLIRLGENSEHCSEVESSPKGGRITFIHDTPWPHETLIEIVNESDMNKEVLIHSLTVSYLGDVSMPLSMGFHPYFATYNKPFSIRYNGVDKKSADIEHNTPFFLKKSVENTILSLNLGHSLIEISIDEGDYEGFYIWTDSISQYICVEPVLGKPGDQHHTLTHGQTRTGVCKMTYSEY
jgi:hypothetical protein